MIMSSAKVAWDTLVTNYIGMAKVNIVKLHNTRRDFENLQMKEIEDMLPSMQLHVVGAPRTWVRLFRHLARAVDDYNRAHRP